MPRVVPWHQAGRLALIAGIALSFEDVWCVGAFAAEAEHYLYERNTDSDSVQPIMVN